MFLEHYSFMKSPLTYCRSGCPVIKRSIVLCAVTKRRAWVVLRKMVFSSTIREWPSFSFPLSVGSGHGLVL